MNGYENDDATELFRQVFGCCGTCGLRGDKTDCSQAPASPNAGQDMETAGGFSEKVKRSGNKYSDIKG